MMITHRPLLLMLASATAVFAAPATFDRDRAVLEEHHIPCGPLPKKHETHAATITECKDGTLIAAWFGGTGEHAPDVKIWASRKEVGKDWTEPFIADTGNRIVNGKEKEFCCWNPVLFTHPDGTVYLYYKITGLIPNKGFRNWWGAVKTSRDSGKTWSKRIWLPSVSTEGDLKVFKPYGGHACGPVKNRPVILADGGLLCGASTETSHGWRVHFEIYKAGDWTGEKHGVRIVGPLLRGLVGIQPSFLTHSKDLKKLQVLTRDNGTAWSDDGGKSWTPVTKGPIKTSNGFHAVSLDNGWHFLALNPKGRSPLSLARTRDGIQWETILPELSKDGGGKMDYPTMLRSKDGKLHIVHSWHRRNIRHLVLDTKYLCGDSQAEK
jgi:alpha-L-rhamnosidase